MSNRNVDMDLSSDDPPPSAPPGRPSVAQMNQCRHAHNHLYSTGGGRPPPPCVLPNHNQYHNGERESLVDDEDDFAFVESLVDDEVDFAIPNPVGHMLHPGHIHHVPSIHGAFDRLSIDSASSHGTDADTLEELMLLRQCLENDPIEVSSGKRWSRSLLTLLYL